MNRKGLLFLIFSIAIAVTVTWLNSFWLTYQDLVTESNEKQVDYYLSNFSLLNTSSTGEMKYFMQGQHLVHKNSTGGSEIFQPLIQANDSDGQGLLIQAEKASQENSEGVIELDGAVVIKKTNKLVNNETKSTGFTLETQKLSFNPNKREVFTEDAVTLTTKDGLLTGKGLRSNLDEQELRILSNVHSKFEPTP